MGRRSPRHNRENPDAAPCGHLPGPGLASEQEDRPGKRGRRSPLRASGEGGSFLPPSQPQVRRRGQTALPLLEGDPTAIGMAAASSATVCADLSLGIHSRAKDAPAGPPRGGGSGAHSAKAVAEASKCSVTSFHTVSHMPACVPRPELCVPPSPHICGLPDRRPRW